MASVAQIKASTKFNKTRDSITIRPDKGTGAKIRNAADRLNISITELIITAVDEYLAKQNKGEFSRVEPQEKEAKNGKTTGI